MIYSGTVDTPIGKLEVHWSKDGLKRLRLANVSSKATPVRPRKKTSQSRGQAAAPPVPSPVPARIQKRVASFFKGQAIPIRYFDQAGWTGFQTRVVLELLKLKPGQTISYAELATRAENPKAVRAVGSLMRKNALPLLIPCHRVMPTGNTIGHYSFHEGPTTKARLLNFERVLSRQEGKNLWEFDWTHAVRHLKTLPLRERHKELAERLNPSLSLFQTLARSIVGQQIHPAAARAIWARLKPFHNPKKMATAPHTTIRELGLSERKAASIQQLARETVSGKIPTLEQAFFLSNDQLIEKLTSIKGIGRWTVEMVLIFQLGRADVWPIADFGMRRGLEKFLGSKKPLTAQQMEKYGQQFAPFQTAASLFFWDYHGAHPDVRTKAKLKKSA